VKGTKAEVRPGVWKLRVYVGRSPTGSPIHAFPMVRIGSVRAERRPTLRHFVVRWEIDQSEHAKFI